MASSSELEATIEPDLERLPTALPFIQLANTDDDFMTEHAEAILTGSAFEQLLAGDASAYTTSLARNSERYSSSLEA